VAGSKSPSAFQALGEAAPAVRGYAKTKAEIRKEQNNLLDSRAKLTQLKLAETQGNKEEVRKIRQELRQINQDQAQIEDRAFKRFNDERTLNLNLISAESKLATAKTAEKRQNATLAVQNAQLAISKNKLETQAGDITFTISNLKKDLPRLTGQRKQQAEEAIKFYEDRLTDVTKTIQQTKTPSALQSMTMQTRLLAQQKSLQGQITADEKKYRSKDYFLKTQLDKSAAGRKRAEEEYAAFQTRLKNNKKLLERINQQLGGKPASGVTSLEDLRSEIANQSK